MRKFLLAFSLLAAFGVIGLNTVSSSALSGSEFQAGRIIDDSIFFGTGNISPSDIQLFLNSKVPVCDTNGTQPYAGTTRAAYGTSKGYPPPYICLRNYSQDTPTKPAETGLCNQYNGGAKSAAQIIYDVGSACGVNPRTLIVLLEKEQSLVTDDWPWTTQYRSATGYGCPDTAPCDAEYYGFFNQVFSAARQFKKYQRDSSLFRYRANRDNFIQYNPNAGCGGTNVYIQNQATAGLYNYTPYQPNAAALANLGGQGDGCSAYGNRNFWVLFNNWFGTVNGPAYDWQLISQEFYSDAARTQPFTASPTVQPGQKMYLRIKLRNTGFQTWNNSSMRLGTSNPRDRNSALYDTSWISGSRATSLTEATVQPSQQGTFDFTMSAPSSTGTYYEYFTPVADGIAWLRDIGMYFPINVVAPVSAPNTQRSGLNSGDSLGVEDYILSPDTQSSLILQRDGNLVMYTDLGRLAWSSNTSGQPKILTMQTDGNLVVYSQSGTAIWNSGTNGNPGARLAMKSDGGLVIYSVTDTIIWTAGVVHNPDHLAYVNNTLHTGVVFPGQYLETASRKYKMIFQNDGNFVIYSPTRAIWSSGTYGNNGARLVMQSDGNLVIYSKTGQALWNTRTSQHGPSYLVLNQDGNAILFNRLVQATWASNTAGQQ